MVHEFFLGGGRGGGGSFERPHGFLQGEGAVGKCAPSHVECKDFLQMLHRDLALFME